MPIFCDTISRVTLFNLIATLNTSFPDYDFTDAKGDNFSKVPTLDVSIVSYRHRSNSDFLFFLVRDIKRRQQIGCRDGELQQDQASNVGDHGRRNPIERMHDLHVSMHLFHTCDNLYGRLLTSDIIRTIIRIHIAKTDARGRSITSSTTRN